MEDKNKINNETLRITDDGIKTMFEYERKLIRKIAIGLWLVFLIATSGILIWLNLAK